MGFARLLNIDLPPGQSAFLFGPRKTGKTTYLRQRFPDSICFDFLKTDLFLEYLKTPSLLRERLAAKDESHLRHPIILDEVQKVPHILDEVHWLIENRGLSFILCGSSARKLKRDHANLDKNFEIRYWRTRTGTEIDFVLGDGEVAIEVKGSSSLKPADLKGIRTFVGEYGPTRGLVVCNEREPRTIDGIRIVPWRQFLHELWGGTVL